MVGPLIEASVSLMIMSLPNFLLLKPHRCSRAPSYTNFYLKSLNHRVQKFATHRDSVNLDNRQSPLSQSPLDAGRNRSQLRLESIGPFNLGTSQRALRGGEGTKKWSELSTGGKGSFSVHCPNTVLLMLHSAMRTASHTKNLAIILIGAGLASLLIYTVTSEIYSSNSPTNLFKDACERIKRNQRACRCFY